VVKWWDRFWSVIWFVGSGLAAYWTARWFAVNASPADLGGLRYGLIAFSGLFGLLIGAFLTSIAVIGLTSGIEALFARAGHPFRRPPLEGPTFVAPEAQESPESTPAAALTPSEGD
jgi:hypothetical protein